MQRLFHPLLALIASASDRALAKHFRYLKEENRILRDRTPGQIHTRPHERARLLNSVVASVTQLTSWSRLSRRARSAAGCVRKTAAS